jgi:pimeloyl-ACP methyl ester carboxylesterase
VANQTVATPGLAAAGLAAAGLPAAGLPDAGLTRVNGIELAYQVFGQGDPLILLHGGFGSVEMFGDNVAALAAGRQVIGVDLQSHGRSPATDRPMRFDTMADDIAALIRHLGLAKADVMGFSLGGGVALRTAVQHPDVVDRLVLVSTPFKRSGWYPEMTAAMDAMGPDVAPMMRRTPFGDAYAAIAPRVDDWPILVSQVTDLLHHDYDWTAEARAIATPTMLVMGDADGLPPRHAVEFFELLGGGQRDSSWDRSGMTEHRLAVLPGVTHYDINVRPELATTVAGFLDR